MTSSDDLSPEAKHLLRAARGADRATPGQIEDAVRTFRATRRDAARSRTHATVFARGVRRSTPWAVLAAILSGTLGAYATVGQSLGLPLPGWWPDFATWSQIDTAVPPSTAGYAAPRESRAGSGEHTVRSLHSFEPGVPPSEHAAPSGSEAEPLGARLSAPVGPLALDAESPAVALVTKASGSDSAQPTFNPTAKLPATSKHLETSIDTPAPARAGRTSVVPSVTPTNEARALEGSIGPLALEVETLTHARDALNAGDCPAARHHLDRHRLEFPRGVLSEERQALSAICECRTGAGSAAAELYVSRRAESPLTRRVAKECGISRAE